MAYEFIFTLNKKKLDAAWDADADTVCLAKLRINVHIYIHITEKMP